jgi:hypothetical protein
MYWGLATRRNQALWATFAVCILLLCFMWICGLVQEHECNLDLESVACSTMNSWFLAGFGMAGAAMVPLSVMGCCLKPPVRVHACPKLHHQGTLLLCVAAIMA